MDKENILEKDKGLLFRGRPQNCWRITFDIRHRVINRWRCNESNNIFLI